MVHLDIELVSHPCMSVCEAFLFAMCLQQQYDFFSHLCCLYCRRHDQCLKSVDTIVFLGRLTHIPCFSKTPYRRTAIPFQPIVEQAKKEYQKLLSQSNTAICQYPLQYP